MSKNKSSYNPRKYLKKKIYLVNDDDYLSKTPKEYAKIISDKVFREVRKKIKKIE